MSRKKKTEIWKIRGNTGSHEQKNKNRRYDCGSLKTHSNTSTLRGLTPVPRTRTRIGDAGPQNPAPTILPFAGLVATVVGVTIGAVALTTAVMVAVVVVVAEVASAPARSAEERGDHGHSWEEHSGRMDSRGRRVTDNDGERILLPDLCANTAVCSSACCRVRLEIS